MKPALPKSETNLYTNLLGFIASLLAIYFLKDSGISRFDTALAVLAISVTPILLLEFFVHKRHRQPTAKLGATRKADQSRVLVKCLGLMGVLVIFGALYALIPEYDKPYYNGVWPFYLSLLPFILIGAPFYFMWCDARQDDPEDGYYQLGQYMLLRWKGRDGRDVLRLLRNWLVKAFFLPLMFTYAIDSISSLQTTEIPEKLTFMKVFLVAQAIIMFADLLYATLGYVFTLRMFNAHIRSSEPTFLGWFVAIMCYYPFWQLLFYPSFLAYDDGLNWDEIIPTGIAQYIWGSAILFFYTIYSLATVCLGIRFSNLTYRGLVSNGPYRFTKHPAYVTKNIAWWLVSMPFISHVSIGAALTCTVALMGISTIYFIRARTEERHLSNYPEYVEYALAMNERSIFAPLAKRLTFLQYKKPLVLPKI